MPPAVVPETVTDLFGESTALPFAVTVTSPALVVDPAAKVSVAAVLKVKSAATAPAPAPAATVTASLDGFESVAVTVTRSVLVVALAAKVSVVAVLRVKSPATAPDDAITVTAGALDSVATPPFYQIELDGRTSVDVLVCADASCGKDAPPATAISSGRTARARMREGRPPLRGGLRPCMPVPPSPPRSAVNGGSLGRSM